MRRIPLPARVVIASAVAMLALSWGLSITPVGPNIAWPVAIALVAYSAGRVASPGWLLAVIAGALLPFLLVCVPPGGLASGGYLQWLASSTALPGRPNLTVHLGGVPAHVTWSYSPVHILNPIVLFAIAALLGHIGDWHARRRRAALLLSNPTAAPEGVPTDAA